jgi:hypothetical protein
MLRESKLRCRAISRKAALTLSNSSSTAENSAKSKRQHDPAGSICDRLIASIIRSIDGALRCNQGIFEFCLDDRCAFRLSFRTFARAHEWPDGTRVEAGVPVGELHLWHEHLAGLGIAQNFGFASEYRRRLLFSMRALAAHARCNPCAAAVPGFFADSWLGLDYSATSLTRILLRWGFRIDEESKRLEFWRQLYVRLLALAFHPDTSRGPCRRIRIWISRGELIRRYGGISVNGSSGDPSM